MAQPVRHDGYGRPLPELADARQEVLLERPSNRAQRKLLQQLLENQAALLLRRGIYAEVSVRFVVSDGVIQSPVDVIVNQHYKLPEGL